MPDEPVALAVLPGKGVAFAAPSGSRAVATHDIAGAVAELAAEQPRWVWWSARETATPLIRAGVRIRACWDLAAVSRLL